MPEIKRDRPLKVCSTCLYWTPRLKGYCDRLQQGAGKFHICEGWSGDAAETEDLILAKAQEAANRS
jgi:hypothetical protein